MRRYRLPKCKILRTKKDIQQLFREGRYFPGRHFDLVVRTDVVDSKVLFTVSKKIRKKVFRNRIKRRLREVYRLNQYEIPAPLHIAMIGKAGALTADFQQLQAEFKQILSKIMDSWRPFY